MNALITFTLRADDGRRLLDARRFRLIIRLVVETRDAPFAVTTGQSLRPLATVDVVADEVVENVLRLATGACQIHDARVVDRELGEFATERCLNEEPLFIGLAPEVVVIGENPGQDVQECAAHVDRSLAILDLLDAPALVDEREERRDVGTHDVGTEDLDSPVQGRHELVHLHTATRRLVRMEQPRDLCQGKRRDELPTCHPLSPADAIVEGEAPVRRRQAVEHGDGFARLPLVAQEDVGRDLHPKRVQDVEALGLPLLGGAEMNRGTEADRHFGLGSLKVHPGGDALEPIDDVDGVHEDKKT